MNLIQRYKIPLIILFITILIIVGGVFLFSRDTEKTTIASTEIPSNSLIYFYGQGCAHCNNVEEFMNSWEKKDSINLIKMEVWYNNENAKIIASEAEKCGISRNNLAVPLLITPEGQCLTGDTPIIDYLKTLQ